MTTNSWIEYSGYTIRETLDGQWLITKDGANVMPGGASGLTKADCYMAADLLVAVDGDAPKFWGLWRAIRGMDGQESHTHEVKVETVIDPKLEEDRNEGPVSKQTFLAVEEAYGVFPVPEVFWYGLDHEIHDEMEELHENLKAMYDRLANLGSFEQKYG